MNLPTIPHLTTALTGPLQALEKLFLEHQVAIEGWFRTQWHKTPPPFYSSVDLRNAGFKLAPVDTNLFPAGFNNLNPAFLPLCVQAVQATIAEICPNVTRLLLVPESHSRNLFYFESLARLQEILQQAGFAVRIGSLDPTVTAPRTVTTASGRTLQLEPLTRVDQHLQVDNFIADAIILNNDLSEGVPPLLEGLQQPILPSAQLGWSSRLKSEHFEQYQAVCQEFSLLLDCDPWLFNPLFDNCADVDFMQQAGLECVYRHAQQLLMQIRYKYEQYGITQAPFLVIKADAGTYGMAVMMIKTAEELLSLNRKQRTRMSTIKGGQRVHQVMLQEGVYTFETVGESASVAEPVVYNIGRHVIGGFYRLHTERGPDENLNAPGMNFQPLAFADCCQSPLTAGAHEAENRFYAYGVVARLATLAAARELAALTRSTGGA